VRLIILPGHRRKGQNKKRVATWACRYAAECEVKAGKSPQLPAQNENLILSALHDIITEAIAVRRFVARLVSVAQN
jgi:hypothetical protein